MAAASEVDLQQHLLLPAIEHLAQTFQFIEARDSEIGARLLKKAVLV